MISQENPKNFSSPRTSRRKRRGAVFFSATAFAAASLTGFAADAAVDDTPVMAFDTDLATICDGVTTANAAATFTNHTLVLGVEVLEFSPFISEDMTLYLGTAGDDVFVIETGSLTPNVVLAGDGNDIVCGSSEDDTVHGGAGSDQIYGAGGVDKLRGGADADHIDGGAGDDIINGNRGADLLEGDIGSDDLNGGFGDDTLVGGAGDDDLDGGDGANVLFGGLGADTYISGTGNVCADVDQATPVC